MRFSFPYTKQALQVTDNSLFMHKFGENNIFVSKVSGDHLVDCENFSNELDRIFLSEPIIVTVGRKPSVFVSGTGFLNYKHLFKDIRKINYNFYLDSKSAYPDARFLNMCSYFRAAGEIKNRGLSTMSAQGVQTCEQIDPLAGQDLDIQSLKTMQSGQNERVQTVLPGQTESIQVIQPGQLGLNLKNQYLQAIKMLYRCM